ncbi:hypothetical protein EKD04_004405 [Chloroflexales bacterium ZM16-3]|nr:hypothetical protein [Chloroflexales bacterium ZM16-3]
MIRLSRETTAMITAMTNRFFSSSPAAKPPRPPSWPPKPSRRPPPPPGRKPEGRLPSAIPAGGRPSKPSRPGLNVPGPDAAPVAAGPDV